MSAVQDKMADRQEGRAKFEFSRALLGHTGSVTSVRFQPPDAELLASCSGDMTLRVWDPQQGIEMGVFTGHKNGLNDFGWRGDGRGFCTASTDCSIAIWDINSQAPVVRLEGHASAVVTVKYSSNEQTLVSGGFDDTVRMWDTRQGKCVKTLSDHSDPVTSVDMNHDDSLICSTSFDGLLRLWDARAGNCISLLQEDHIPPRPLTFGKFTPNGKFVLMMTLDGTLMLIDVDTREIKRQYQSHMIEHRLTIPAITHAPGPGGNRWVVSGSQDGSIGVWDVQRRKKGGTLDGPSCLVQVSQRIGNFAATGVGHRQGVSCVGAHPTLPCIASGSLEGDSSIRIWEERRQGNEIAC